MKYHNLFFVLLFIVACEPKVFKISTPAMEETIPQGLKIVINRDIPPKRNDIVVFKYPSQDAEYFTFRMIAQPGDTLLISDALCWINSEPEIPEKTFQYAYIITTDQSLTDRFFEEQKIKDAYRINSGYIFYLTTAKAEELRKVTFIKSIERLLREQGEINSRIFEDYYGWNEDQFGKLYIPKEGDKITGIELSRYKKTFLIHEGVEVSNLKEYTVNNSYCFVMGDSRHNAMDSRFIGLIPMKSIIGKVNYVGPIPSNIILP